MASNGPAGEGIGPGQTAVEFQAQGAEKTKRPLARVREIVRFVLPGSSHERGVGTQSTPSSSDALAATKAQMQREIRTGKRHPSQGYHR